MLEIIKSSFNEGMNQEKKIHLMICPPFTLLSSMLVFSENT